MALPTAVHHKRRSLVVAVALAVIFASGAEALAQVPAAPEAAPTAVPATPDTAKAFLGDWAATVETPNGAATFTITVKVEADKVAGGIASDMGQNAVTDIARLGPSLVMRYSISFDGNAIPVVLTLTPEADKVRASFSIADGAFEMGGLATKKP